MRMLACSNLFLAPKSPSKLTVKGSHIDGIVCSYQDLYQQVDEAIPNEMRDMILLILNSLLRQAQSILPDNIQVRPTHRIGMHYPSYNVGSSLSISRTSTLTWGFVAG